MTTFRFFAQAVPVALLLGGCGTATRQAEPRPGASTGTVTIRIIDDDGTQSVEVADVAAGTTVESVMRSVEGIDVEIAGSGPSAFVESLNRRSTSTDSGWTYRIDGVFAKAGIGVTKLDPPATITWKFGGWDED